jgi:aminomethyltransferase
VNLSGTSDSGGADRIGDARSCRSGHDGSVVGPLKKTPLHALHVRLGARMVEFGGYDMPIQYADGIMAEHNWTRTNAGLFDVSHMGPSFLSLPQLGGGDDAHRKVSALVEKLVPSDIAALAPGKVQLTVLLNENGGIIDDLMIGRPADPARAGMLYIVVNAGTKENDFALIAKAAEGSRPNCAVQMIAR